jgi:hypothetical protein
MSDTDHHHHHPHNHLRREPLFENPSVRIPTCLRFDDPFGKPRNDCFGPAKTTPGTHSRS